MYKPRLNQNICREILFKWIIFLPECLLFLKKYLSLQPLTRTLASLELELFNGVMVAQQILVLFVQVRILVEQRFQSFKFNATIQLFNGVMVAQQILVLFVQVRILVEQQKRSVIRKSNGSFCL